MTPSRRRLVGTVVAAGGTAMLLVAIGFVVHGWWVYSRAVSDMEASLELPPDLVLVERDRNIVGDPHIRWVVRLQGDPSERPFERFLEDNGFEEQFSPRPGFFRRSDGWWAYDFVEVTSGPGSTVEARLGGHPEMPADRSAAFPVVVLALFVLITGLALRALQSPLWNPRD